MTNPTARPITLTDAQVRELQTTGETTVRILVGTYDGPIPDDTHVPGLPPNPQNVRMCGLYAKCDAPPGSGHVSCRIDPPWVWGAEWWGQEEWQLAFWDWEDGIYTFRYQVDEEEVAYQIPEFPESGFYAWTDWLIGEMDKLAALPGAFWQTANGKRAETDDEKEEDGTHLIFDRAVQPWREAPDLPEWASRLSGTIAATAIEQGAGGWEWVVRLAGGES